MTNNSWISIGVLLLGLTIGVATSIAERKYSPVFIAGDYPLTQEQIRQKLRQQGYTDIRIAQQGDLVQALARNGGVLTKVVVDPQTGRIRYDRYED